ncbi:MULTISPECIES: isoleucine--tRNA ligase [Candidatus Ichthyocystis]|uniref:Isoleucine--tRNA ligase n=1 Tax=Candidatus Ichthyocystis hellenicum TaxID=1561003 RepID=A0A0S4M216_9BURK|nr:MULTISPECIES: isoleucine--tRNA ligase [Ichthyocystis]CUT16930.1 Isoleucine--tRNA ligase [Candidatus Ichthyocystis hellenicum]
MTKKTDKYRHTLNLPDTPFPMRANLAKNEVIWIDLQKKNKFFSRLRDKTKNFPSFVLHDGPPYANGDIHMGHAVNKILKDIIVRYKVLTGFNAVLTPGWDCHGMPIEVQIEKIHGRHLPTDKLFSLSRDYAKDQINIQKNGFMRLAILADWDNPYLTMDSRVEANEVRLIGELYENGLLKRGLKPVHWCLDCMSALAEAEVEYEDKISQSIDVAFDVTVWPDAIKDICAKFNQARVVIWTTTPWTLPSNQAVCVHPDMCYVVLRAPDGFVIVADELYRQFVLRCGWSDDDVLVEMRFSGSDLKGMLLRHPFYEREVPILMGNHVTSDSGTGLVHTAPAHGLHDYQICLDEGIDPQIIVNDDGCFDPSVEIFSGVNVRDADPLVLAVLEKSKALLSCHSIEHSYPHCWRHRTATIFRATPQWFICLDDSLPGTDDTIRSLSLREIDKVEFFPARGRSRLRSMISTRPDWCLSRQRRWGVPLPFFLHRATGEPHPRTKEFIERIADIIEKNGIEAWSSISPDEWLDGDEVQFYYKLTDTVDVWFDSGVTHSTVLRGSHRDLLRYPADVYLEGSDQHRGWFHSALLTSCALDGKSPYRQLITHGFVVDASGYKMSKSRGNVISPHSIVEDKGADILRLWIASTDYTREMSLSETIIGNVVDVYRRIRNTVRFLLANTRDCDYSKDVLPIGQLLELDRYMLLVLRDAVCGIRDSYERYDFSAVVRAIYQLCSEDLGAFYLDVLKDRLYSSALTSSARRSAQTVLHHIIRSLLSVCAPIICFTADEAWQYLNNDDSDYVLLHGWCDVPSVPDADVLRMRWDMVRDIRAEIMRALEVVRERDKLGSSWESSVVITAGGYSYDQLLLIGNDLRFVLMVASVKIFQSEVDGISNIEVESAVGEKCIRCWHVCEEVNVSEEFPGICERCLGNIKGKEEGRSYA